MFITNASGSKVSDNFDWEKYFSRQLPAELMNTVDLEKTDTLFLDWLPG